jgi:hypothetical protein
MTALHFGVAGIANLWRGRRYPQTDRRLPA